jgi:hypothetical protein
MSRPGSGFTTYADVCSGSGSPSGAPCPPITAGGGVCGVGAATPAYSAY